MVEEMIGPGELISQEETEEFYITTYKHGKLKYSNGATVIIKRPKVVSLEVQQKAIDTLYELAAQMYGVDVRNMKIIFD